MDKVALLAELRVLSDNVPDFDTYAPSSRPHLEWLGKAHALLAQWSRSKANLFASNADLLAFKATRNINVAQLLGVLHRAIAELELQVPALPDQAFGPGAVYDFLKTLRDLLASATNSVFIIDPYLDEQIFDEYLSTISSQVVVRLLTMKCPASLKPAVSKYIAQTRSSVEVRTSKAIHDRVIFLDYSSCWVLGQSIKNAAKSKPTYLVPLATDSAKLKKEHYEIIWTSANAI